MAQSDALKRYLDAGMAFTQLTRTRAEQVVKDLVAAGELQQKQAKGAIDDLVDRSRKNAELINEVVRSEVASQLANLGLATRADIERLEAEIGRLAFAQGAGPQVTPPSPAAAQATATSSPAKKAAKRPAPAPAPDAAPTVSVASPATPVASEAGGAAGAAASRAAKAAKKGTAGHTLGLGEDPSAAVDAATSPKPAKAAPAKKAVKKA